MQSIKRLLGRIRISQANQPTGHPDHFRSKSVQVSVIVSGFAHYSIAQRLKFFSRFKSISLFIRLPGVLLSFYFSFTDRSSSRPAELVFQTIKDVKGVEAYRFVLSSKVFASTVSYPENECYCMRPNSSRGICRMDGVFDLSGCAKGAPFVSEPVKLVCFSLYQGELANL